MSDELNVLFDDLAAREKELSEKMLDLSKLISRINNSLSERRRENDSSLEKLRKFVPIESDIIKFNVGGQVFSTFRSTITKRIKKLDQEKDEAESYYEPNLLEGLIGGLVDIRMDESNAIFIDRNPKYFPYILDYLRDNERFPLPKTKDKVEGLLREAEYYNVQGLVEVLSSSDESLNSSKILSAHQINELIKLCDFKRKDKWKLVYRGSRDGFNSHDFHSKCDDIPNTLTIVQSTKGNVFGGFASVPWDQNGQFQNDHNAFLFSLGNEHSGPTKIEFIHDGNAIFCTSEFGPAFGAGHDLYISSDCNKNDLSYSNLGYSYLHPRFKVGSTEAHSFLAGSYKFKVKEMEVFSIMD